MKKLFSLLILFLGLGSSFAANDLIITSITRTPDCTTLKWISHTGEFYTVYATEDLRTSIRWRTAGTFVPSGGTNTTWQEGCCGGEFSMMSLSSGGWSSLSEKEREDLLAAAKARSDEGVKFLTEKMQEATNSSGGGMSALSAPAPGGGGTNTNGGPVIVTARFYRVSRVATGFVDGWGYGVGDLPEGTNFVTVAAGWFDSGTHNLALHSNGTVVAWGANQYGQTNVPAGLTNVIAIAAGGRHSVAVRRNGTLTNWGDTTLGQITNTPAYLTNLVDVKAGLWHTLALRADGTVAVWGDLFNRTNAVPAGLADVRAISAGPRHCLALRCDGTVVAWGFTLTNNLLNNYLPTNVPASLSNVVAISAGMEHNQALLKDGTVCVWGNTNNPALKNLPALTNLLSMSAGWHYGVALSNYVTAMTNYNTLLTWGQIGDHDGRDSVVAVSAGAQHVLVIRTNNEAPVIIRHPRRIIEPPGTATNLSVVASSSLLLSYQWQMSNTVWVNISGATNATLPFPNLQTTDDGHYRVRVSTAAKTIDSRSARVETLQAPIIASQSPELNLPRPQDSQGVVLSVQVTNQGAYFLRYNWFKDGQPLPLAMLGLLSVTFESTNREGSYHVVVSNAAGGATSAVWQVSITLHGEARMWGDDSSGQRNGLSRNDTNLVAVAAGGYHTVGLRENGTVLVWGSNANGQTNAPNGLTNVVAIAGGGGHSLALLENGTVRAWGNNTCGQTNVPTGLTNVTALAAGGPQSLALRQDGSLIAWGCTPVPAGVSNIAAMAAGPQNTLGLLSNGTVLAWNGTSSTDLTPPAGLSNVVAVACEYAHALALRKDGTVVAWGQNTYGQTNVPAGLSNVMKIATGNNFNMALRNDGTVVSWGRNQVGQTNVPNGLTNICAITAGQDHSVALAYNAALEYPVTVEQDLLLIYNTNSSDSIFVKDYYLAHRPLVSQANVLGIGFAPQETIAREDFTNFIRMPVLNWLAENPTKRPKHWILFLHVPSRIHPVTNVGVYSDSPFPLDNSVSYELSILPPARHPFITCINMGNTNHVAETNDCRAYIDKLAHFGTNYSPGKLRISASDSGYGNTNYYFDDTSYYVLGYASQGRNGVLQSGVSSNSVFYVFDIPDIGLSGHITDATNVSGYMGWGQHSSLGAYCPLDGTLTWHGENRWWIIETVESLNGWRYPEANPQSNFMQWFSERAFGGTNYSNTPVGAVTHTDEPGLSGPNSPAIYFGSWASGKSFSFCAWRSRNTDRFQAVGDPFVRR